MVFAEEIAGDLDRSAHLLWAQSLLDESSCNPNFHEVAKAQVDPPVIDIDLGAPEWFVEPPICLVSTEPPCDATRANTRQAGCFRRRVDADADQIAIHTSTCLVADTSRSLSAG